MSHPGTIDSIEFNAARSPSSRSDKLQPSQSGNIHTRRRFRQYAYGVSSKADDHKINSSPDPTLKPCTLGLKKCYNRQNLIPTPAGNGVDSSSSSEKTREIPKGNDLMSRVNITNGDTPRVKDYLSYPESLDNIWRPDEWPSLDVLTNVKNVNGLNTRDLKPGFGVGSSLSKNTCELSVTADLEILQLNSIALEGIVDDACLYSFMCANKSSSETDVMPQASGANECLRLLRNENSCINGTALGKVHVSHKTINNGVLSFETSEVPKIRTVLDEEPTCAYEMTDYVASYKLNQVVNKVFSKIFHGDDEGARAEDLIYKHLWLNAEAKKCARELSVQVCRMKSDIEKGLISSNKDATSLPALIYKDLWRKAHLENKVKKHEQHESRGVSENNYYEEENKIDNGDSGEDGEYAISGKASYDNDNEDSLDAHDKSNNGIYCTTENLENEHSSHWSDKSKDDLDSWSAISNKTSHGDDIEDSLVTHDESDNGICCTTDPHWSDNSSSDWELLSKNDYS